ncbi:EamA family transporter, partial [Mycobacterium sp. ITM-2017-0098]
MAALRVVIVSYPLALVLLTLLAVPFGGQISAPAVWWGLLSGVAQAFGVWWFYAALGSGPISVVSPLTAVLVAGIPV